MPKRHADEVHVDEGIVRRLLGAQFPQWADLPLSIVEPAGTDHTIFRLGDELVARMPVRPAATEQARREARWVPFLAPRVPLELPRPVAMGRPGEGYPLAWSIVRWIDGEKGTPDTLDLDQAAVDLARFVRALQACDARGGPPAGPATWLRGMPLGAWVDRLDPWMARLDYERSEEVLAVWDAALAADEWNRPPVWFHGDLMWNLIARDRRVVGIIDSPYGVGDPACDLMAAWILFRGEQRRRFLDEVGADDATIVRSRGLTVAPAIIGWSYYREIPHLRELARRSFEGALAD